MNSDNLNLDDYASNNDDVNSLISATSNKDHYVISYQSARKILETETLETLLMPTNCEKGFLREALNLNIIVLYDNKIIFSARSLWEYNYKSSFLAKPIKEFNLDVNKLTVDISCFNAKTLCIDETCILSNFYKINEQDVISFVDSLKSDYEHAQSLHTQDEITNYSYYDIALATSTVAAGAVALNWYLND